MELEAGTVQGAVILSDMLRRGRDDLRSTTTVWPAAGAPGDEAPGRRKRFPVVVDGVWSDKKERRNWENDMMPGLRADTLRAPGSMVVVTTRRRPAVVRSCCSTGKTTVTLLFSHVARSKLCESQDIFGAIVPRHP